MIYKCPHCQENLKKGFCYSSCINLNCPFHFEIDICDNEIQQYMFEIRINNVKQFISANSKYNITYINDGKFGKEYNLFVPFDETNPLEFMKKLANKLNVLKVYL